MKANKLISNYVGEGDVVVWLEKFKLVVKLQKIEDAGVIVPLFLEGPAFAVYNQMAEKDKVNFEAIEDVLLDAFALDQFQAYETLIHKKWSGEPVDVFLADVRRLAKLSRISKEAFIKKCVCSWITTRRIISTTSQFENSCTNPLRDSFANSSNSV